MQEVDITNPLKVLARAIALTGSLHNLSRLSGINRGTLRNIYKKKYNTNMATMLRLKDFVDHHENRVGRPFKKSTNEVRNEHSL
jgi:hypothetical protein